MTSTITTNGRIQTAPVNDMPVGLIETIEHEAMGYRSWGNQTGDLLADQMDRLAQLIRWTGASTSQEHLDRMEVWDTQISEGHFDRGYAEGYEAARRESRGHLA